MSILHMKPNGLMMAFQQSLPTITHIMWHVLLGTLPLWIWWVRFQAPTLVSEWVQIPTTSLRHQKHHDILSYVIIWCMSAFAPAVEWNYGQARLSWLRCNGPWRWWHFIGSIRHQCQWLRHLIGHNVALTSVTWRWWQLWRWLLWRLLWRIWWWLAWHIWHSIIICHHSS